MALAIVFAALVISAGFATLRTLGLSKGAVAIGLAPGAGLAVLSVVSTWLVLLAAPAPVAGLAVLVVAVAGLAMLERDRSTILDAVVTLWVEQRVALITLGVSVIVPAVVMGVAFAGVEVPLSPHDGAAHTEAIQIYRQGQAIADWYPPGLTAVFGAFLQLLPWLDSAKGAFELGLSLPLLAALSVFGLGVAIWSDLRIAAAASLLLGFTYLYPYFPELWSGWPLAASLVLVVTVWALGIEYLRRPSTRSGVMGGLLLGAVVLTHGTELYTLVLVLPLVLLAAWRRVQWGLLARDVAVAAIVGVACSAIYMPLLLHWAGSGGAYSVGLEDGQVPQAPATSASASVSAGPNPFVVFALGALGVDLPLRVGLLAIGAVWAIRHRSGRSVLIVGLLFSLLASAFTFLSVNVGPVHQVYAITFPWGMHYRLFMLVAIAQVLLAGAGAVVLLHGVGSWAAGRGATRRLAGRLARVLVLAWFGVMTLAMTAFMVYPTGLVLGYGPDDAAAMAWLRAQGAPGAVVANDGYADAGIWVPYKTGLSVLLPRWGPESGDPRRRLVFDNVARLEAEPMAAAAACALHVAYVYRGARASEWDARAFPPLEELRTTRGLQEVFSSGEAAIFRVGIPCSVSGASP